MNGGRESNNLIRKGTGHGTKFYWRGGVEQTLFRWGVWENGTKEGGGTKAEKRRDKRHQSE